LKFKHTDFLTSTILLILKRLILCGQIKCKSLPPIKVYKLGESPERWATNIATLIGSQEGTNKKEIARQLTTNLPWLKKGSRAYCPYYKWDIAENGIIVFYSLPR
jgi:hypothetical protein